MPEASIKTRFAPSPTGRLHLGNVRTALFSALLARRHGGVFLLRIEDTDAGRSREGFRRDLEEDLRWLGLDWDEGPGAEAGNGPYLQSRRQEIYAGQYARLVEQGRAYPCFCSDEALQRARKAQLAAGQAPRYPGTCAALSPQEVEARLAAGARPSLRFRVPPGGRVEFVDLVRGPQSFETDHIGDFIIRRSDGTPAFFFANAVDDALMGVTHVLRGEDHIANTPRQLLLLQALGLKAPAYGHIALIVGADGAPLSKRHGAQSLGELRAAGYLPAAVLNYLARLGHRYDSDRLLDLTDLAEGFELQRLGRAPARHDAAQLHHWQREAVAGLDTAGLQAWLEANAALDPVPGPQRRDFVEAVRDNLVLPEDAAFWAAQLLVDPPAVSAEARALMAETGAEFFRRAAELLPAEANDFKAYAQAVGRATGTRGRALFMPLRAALTGRLHGPELARVFPLIGSERARRRLLAAAS